MPTKPDLPAEGPDDLVLRAVFVPDGEDPPVEFSSLDPLTLSVTLDRATGAITGGEANVTLDGDIRAEWYPHDAESLDNAADEDIAEQASPGGLDDGT